MQHSQHTTVHKFIKPFKAVLWRNWNSWYHTTKNHFSFHHPPTHTHKHTHTHERARTHTHTRTREIKHCVYRSGKILLFFNTLKHI